VSGDGEFDEFVVPDLDAAFVPVRVVAQQTINPNNLEDFRQPPLDRFRSGSSYYAHTLVHWTVGANEKCFYVDWAYPGGFSTPNNPNFVCGG
jgi:hypothetical protein